MADFNTITSDDWKRMFRRVDVNEVRRQIMETKEKFEYCGAVCLAAKNLGFSLMITTVSPFCFAFVDSTLGDSVVGDANDNRIDALYSACTKLTDYLTSK